MKIISLKKIKLKKKLFENPLQCASRYIFKLIFKKNYFRWNHIEIVKFLLENVNYIQEDKEEAGKLTDNLEIKKLLGLFKGKKKKFSYSCLSCFKI